MNLLNRYHNSLDNCRTTMAIFLKLMRNYIYITVTSWWTLWRLKSPALRLLTQPFIQAPIKKKHQSSTSLTFVWVTDEFPSERASNEENVSIWWRHHGLSKLLKMNEWAVLDKNSDSVYCTVYTLTHRCWSIDGDSPNCGIKLVFIIIASVNHDLEYDVSPSASNIQMWWGEYYILSYNREIFSVSPRQLW